MWSGRAFEDGGVFRFILSRRFFSFESKLTINVLMLIFVVVLMLNLLGKIDDQSRRLFGLTQQDKQMIL